MAYSTLFSIENIIDQILHDDRFSLSPNGKGHIMSLDKYVICIRAFLEDFPEKASKHLEARIRDAAIKAEDIIEWFMNQQIRHYVFRYVHWIAELRRVKFESQLRKVTDQMESIAREVTEMKISIITKDAQQLGDSVIGAGSSSSSQVAAAAAAGKMKIVGLSKDLLEIMDWLCGNSKPLQILPITGMGGIGKTTLARNAYNDPLIMEHFQVRVWITISQDYSQERILSDLLDSLFPERRKENNQHGNDSAQEAQDNNEDEALKVFQTLYGRKFLVVIDDVWSSKVLDYVKKLFPNNKNGSRILLTTRLGDVANSSTSTSSHEMRLMDADQSWNLLQEKVLEHHGCIPTELDNTGRQIARSCGGLPLAVVVVAGLLSNASLTLTSWEEIARNVRSATGDDEQIEKILSLSYNHLPHHLRLCFLYMGGFPEDDEIKATSLYRLWIAEGFVKADASRSLEDVAEEYLEGLVERSLVLVVQRKSNGKIKSCNLHDLVREMCVKISEQDKFLVHITGKKKAKGQRRISVSHSDITSFADTFSLNIRTIIYFQDTLSSFGSLRLLRVLDVLKARHKSRLVPDQFFELFHLRYLAFCYDEPIPRAISNLQSLETLIIRASLYRPLPHEIWKMPQLRHLIISGCRLLIPNNVAFAPSSLSLQNLQTLGKVKNLECSVSILRMLPNLKKLRLTFFRGSGDLLLHNIVHLSRLEKLQLELETNWRSPGNHKSHLVVPISLKKLTLIGWGHYEPFINIAGPFPNLQVLKLIKCSFNWTTIEGDFPQLKSLLLDGLHLAEWNVLSSQFPKLEVLVIRSCWRMFKIPDEIGEIPTLELIELKLCPKSMADSARNMQEEKRDNGDNAFRVHCIDCEDIKQLSRILESSVRKPKEVLRKPWISSRRMKLALSGLAPYPDFEPRVVLDSREADLKIVDYKDKDKDA